MKRAVALLATSLLLAGAVLLGRPARDQTPGSPAAAPEDCIERLFEAAERGDVPGYLDCFTGQQRARLAREVAAQSPDVFARSLAEAVRTLKGRAVSRRGDGAAADRAALVVERIYSHRNEAQTYHLVRSGGHWRIEAVDGDTKFQPPIAYGTPVFALPEVTSPAAPPDQP